MSEFRFVRNDLNGKLSTGEKSPLDLLISAAGGEPLPGRWGLIQALADTWTEGTPMPGSGRITKGLWVARSILKSAGVIRAYQRSNGSFQEEKRPTLAEYMEEKDLVWPQEYDVLSHFIYSTLSHLPYTDEVIEKLDATIRTFSLDGIDVMYSFYGKEPIHNTFFQATGPLLRDGTLETFTETFTRYMWAALGGNDLELTSVIDTYGSQTFKLSSIGAVEDFEDGDGSDAEDISAMAERCRAFMDAGLPRRLIFFGAPGTGKSTSARKLAQALGGHALRVEGSALESAGVSSLAKFIKLLRPRVLVCDDLDRSVHEADGLLHAVEDIMRTDWGRQIVLIGTANEDSVLDPALLRPGRFDEVRKFKPPGGAKRQKLLDYYFRKYGVKGVSALKLNSQLEDWTPAEIAELAKSVATVGPKYLEIERERIAEQRMFYSHEKIREWMEKKNF